MFDVVLTPRAETDLDSIWQFTFERWGEAQADKYLEQLDSGIQQLAKTPKLGTSCDDIRTGYRFLHINHHLAYYCLGERQVIVIRILHERMDTSQHFGE